MARITLDPKRSIGTIHKNIYGHFSEHLGRCVYQGMYVGEESQIPNVNGMRTDVVEALKKVGVPVLRWPGGCFADEYHWEDGIGPKENRRRMVNSNWGGVVEDNSFGTHEFMELCRQVGCEPYVCGNVGSGTVREMSEWVEYLNNAGDSTIARKRAANGHPEPFHVKYFGVGNESWGCGGQMRPEYYADEYRRYACFLRQYGDDKLFKIACGPGSEDTAWTKVLMERCGKLMDGLSMHYYTICNNWQHKGSATEFSDEEYYRTLSRALYMDQMIRRHENVMNVYDPEKRVGLVVDEWGTWFDVEPGTNPGFLYQQNTMRDALVASATLDIFNAHCDRVVMANLAQIVNVLQSLVLTDGPRMLLTPTYYVFCLYRAHQGGRQVECQVESGKTGVGDWQVPNLTASASEKDGVYTLTLSNLSMDAPADVTVSLPGVTEASGRMVSADARVYNRFDASPVGIREMEGLEVRDGEAHITLPRCTAAAITLI
ncbi:MAG: alpha-N-arabinofuranosidase [Clostridia bacterium]|nr:alpha-N-arabinofuranosidase [Clostridia bacterium]